MFLPDIVACLAFRNSTMDIVAAPVTVPLDIDCVATRMVDQRAGRLLFRECLALSAITAGTFPNV